jgi:hypothetical protein
MIETILVILLILFLLGGGYGFRSGNNILGFVGFPVVRRTRPAVVLMLAFRVRIGSLLGSEMSCLLGRHRHPSRFIDFAYC